METNGEGRAESLAVGLVAKVRLEKFEGEWEPGKAPVEVVETEIKISPEEITKCP